VKHVLVVSLLGVLLTIWSVYYRRDRERTRREAVASREKEADEQSRGASA